MRLSLWIFSCLFCLTTAFGQHSHDGHDHGHDHDHAGHAHGDGVVEQVEEHVEYGDADGHHGEGHCSCDHHVAEFDAGAAAFHHIADQNIFSIGPFALPLPFIGYSTEDGLTVFNTSYFESDGHGNSCKVKDGYMLSDGRVRRVVAADFPKGEIMAEGMTHITVTTPAGDEKHIAAVCYNGKQYPTEARSTMDFGLFGGGLTTWYDFSISKNVVGMAFIFLLMAVVFLSIAGAYKKREGEAPKGLQNFIEPIFLFIQDEVAKPFLGDKYAKYLPFLMTLFFFILGLNLLGQLPFFGNVNVTGNLAFTAALAVITFFVVNLSGNGHYWEHVLWMPGVPAWVKVILTPVEILGLFIKPLTLALRLFANITAGHIVLTVFVGLIFVTAQSLGSGPAYGVSIGSAILTIFMMAIELLVAFLQAFVFTILTASYLGAATEEVHH